MTDNTTNEVFLAPCRPRVTMQQMECVGEHAVHRRLTEMVHFMCNCGFSSGWVSKDTMPQPSDFLEEHAPTEEDRASLRRAREWAERHHEG